MAQVPTPEFSERLDALWNFAEPAGSEAKFRAELARHPANSREALETSTQIARTQSLRRQWADADRTLDAVARAADANAPAIAVVPPRIRVRYLLERGRTRNSSGDKKAAVVFFNEALAASAQDALPGADFYRVDTLHMLGIAAPANEQLAWNQRALAVAEASPDARARRWAASLHNNIGWTFFESGDPKTALTHWQQALPLREAAGDVVTIRIAKWTIGRGQRALGQLDDAQRIQRALALETEAAGAPDGFIHEELTEIALARGDRAAAVQWAKKAHVLLRSDTSFATDEPARLARLAELAGANAPSPTK